MANKISTKQAIKQLERIIGDLASWQTRNTDNANLQQIQSEVNEPKSLLLRIQKRLEEDLVTEIMDS